MKGRIAVAAAALLVILESALLAGTSSALRGLEKGSKVPDFEFRGVSGEGGRLSSFAGEKGVLVVFWATWSSRSPDILKWAESNLKKYEAQGLRILAVNADHQEMKAEDHAAVKAKAAELALSFPVVHDAGLAAYNEVGVISTPTTLLLDRDLRLVNAYPGFPSVARDEIPEMVEAHLGIVREKPSGKTQYLLAHTPKNHALMYYNMGRQLFTLARSPSGALRSVPGDAVERLDEAITRDPDFFRPYLLKAIIFDLAGAKEKREEAMGALRKKEFREAYEQGVLGLGYLYMGLDDEGAAHLGRAAEGAPGEPPVLFGQAVASARKKDGAGAKKALGALSGNPKAAEALGTDYAALFAPDGTIAPGAEPKVRDALEKLLEIRK